MFVVALLIRPLIAVAILFFIVKPLAKYLMSKIRHPLLRRLLLLRLN